MPKWAFLCLTDLHFADENLNFIDDAKDLGRSYGGSYRVNSLHRVKAIIEHGFGAGDLDFVAVAGDVTTHGSKDGFDVFAKELLPILQPLVPDHGICIVPGNHDVAWSLDPHEKGYYDKKFALFADMVDSAEATTCLLPRGEVKEETHAKTAFNIPKHGPLYVDDVRRVIVLNINSAIRCGELHKDMRKAFLAWHGTDFPLLKPTDSIPDAKAALVSKYFLRDIAQFTPEQHEKLQSILIREKARIAATWDDYLKVAVLHHHIVHYPGQVTEHKGYEFMLDSSLLLDFLTDFDFDVILTGHKHHPYQMTHRFRDKEIFVVGGPTVGGYESHGTFRGFRLLQFEQDGFRKSLSIKDISEDVAKGDIRKALDEIQPNTLRIDLADKNAFNRNLQKHGYSYREIIATTDITSDGDAQRHVRYDGLVLKKPTTRCEEHTISVPPTSGYIDIDRFHAGSASLHIDVVNLTPQSPMPKTAKMKLAFRHSLPLLGEPVSYWCKWDALNSFALDRTQFKRLHPKDESGVNVEFTHFQISDPVETLRIFVRLPTNCRLLNPDIRVVVPDPKVSDSRLWHRNNEATQALKNDHALRLMESLNTVELTVKSPSPDLSYGIEWEVPEPTNKQDTSLGPAIRKIGGTEVLSSGNLSNVLKGIREILLHGWGGEVDISVMVFGLKGHAGMLKSVASARIAKSLVDDHDEIQDLPITLEIPYGTGVAGRSFRADAVQFHVAPETPAEAGNTLEGNFFIPFEGALNHKKLICFPLHIPTTFSSFHNQLKPYSASEPYGILNIGSENEECPLSREQIASETGLESKIRTMQHEINRAIWIQLFGFLDPDVEKRQKNVGKASRRRLGRML